jgi:hypothetical protein
MSEEPSDDVVVFEYRNVGRYGLPDGDQEVTISVWSTPEQLEAAREYITARNKALGLPLPKWPPTPPATASK